MATHQPRGADAYSSCPDQLPAIGRLVYLLSRLRKTHMRIMNKRFTDPVGAYVPVRTIAREHTMPGHTRASYPANHFHHSQHALHCTRHIIPIISTLAHEHALGHTWRMGRKPATAPTHGHRPWRGADASLRELPKRSGTAAVCF